MKRFKNILYVLGDDESREKHTASRVKALATQNEARVCIVRVLEKSFMDQLSNLVSPSADKIPTLARKQLEEDLLRIAEGPLWQGLEVTTDILEGKDFIAIIQKVLRDEHDLVIKTREDDGDTDQLAMRLFRKCPCPVWIIRDTGSGKFKRILAALDLGNNRTENRQLNRKIIELTHSLAKREGAEAHYIHTLHLEFEGMMRGPRFRISDEEIARLKTEMRRESENSLTQLFDECGIDPDEKKIHLLDGETSETIKGAIRDLSVDVLVMGTVARSGVPGLLIGNKAEKVLSGVDCTVLAVKPSGFTSPIKI